MKKEMYDASIHVGQFSLDENIRISCKNAQVRITSKNGIENTSINEAIGVVTYGENTESDNVIRETLSRAEQDVFYPWMDVYHTIKRIEKIRDSNTEVKKLSIHIENALGCKGSNATIIAGAVISGCQTIHTLYDELLKPRLVEEVYTNYKIHIQQPEKGPELSYSGGQIIADTGKKFHLETLYQTALELYKTKKIDLGKKLQLVQKDRT